MTPEELDALRARCADLQAEERSARAVWAEIQQQLAGVRRAIQQRPRTGAEQAAAKARHEKIVARIRGQRRPKVPPV